MDKITENIIREAARLGAQAACPVQLRPSEIGALLAEIDRLREKLNLLRHALQNTIDDSAEALEHTEYGLSEEMCEFQDGTINGDRVHFTSCRNSIPWHHLLSDYVCCPYCGRKIVKESRV